MVDDQPLDILYETEHGYKQVEAGSASRAGAGVSIASTTMIISFKYPVIGFNHSTEIGDKRMNVVDVSPVLGTDTTRVMW